MKTITVQIGNTDDKLTQVQWSKFVDSVNYAVNQFAFKVHFWGGSVNWAEWQNMAWVFECDSRNIKKLETELLGIRVRFNQDSIALTKGITEFI